MPASPFAAKALPPLNPNQPTHNMPAPPTVIVMLCGVIAAVPNPRRGPRTSAATRAATRAAPTAALLAPALVTEYRNIQVTVDAQVAEPSWLILNDSYSPGWKAFVRPMSGGENDEVERPIVRVNGNFRGVQLEPGAWTMRFRYSPASFQLGGLASAMGVIILLFATAVWIWRGTVGNSAEYSGKDAFVA